MRMFATPQLTLSATMKRRLEPEALARILSPLVDASVLEDETRLTRTFARVAWNTVVEPGDGDAGTLAELLGPEVCFALADGQVEMVRHALAFAGDATNDFAKAVARWSPRLDFERVVGMCQKAATVGLRFIAPEDSDWPRQLDDLGPHAPQGLWLRGSVDALAQAERSVAIVGSRASTQYGDRVAGDLAAELAMRDLTVVSGGAYGIDAAAHRAALASGGNTVAILAGGGDRLYPSGNRALLERICADGAVITEAPVGQPPTRWRFLQRNRLIAALSQASVVVEAGARSGALNTANHAMQLGRPLGAVPGPVTSAASVGCHRLLKEQQASLVANSADVLELWREGVLSMHEIGFASRDSAETASPSAPVGRAADESGGFGVERNAPLELADFPVIEEPRLSSAATRVRDALRPRKRLSVAEIARESGMSAAEVRAGLTELQVVDLAVDDESGWRKA